MTAKKGKKNVFGDVAGHKYFGPDPLITPPPRPPGPPGSGPPATGSPTRKRTPKKKK